MNNNRDFDLFQYAPKIGCICLNQRAYMEEFMHRTSAHQKNGFVLDSRLNQVRGSDCEHYVRC